MKIINRIRIIRKFRRLTQKELGIRMGFTEQTAGIRIAQYERNNRLPKNDMINRLANNLNVNPEALYHICCSDITSFMHLLFYLEDIYNISPQKKGKDLCISFGSKKVSNVLLEWYEKKSDYLKKKISKEEYNEWRYTFTDKGGK